jgi:hypothetical protein
MMVMYIDPFQMPEMPSLSTNRLGAEEGIK